MVRRMGNDETFVVVGRDVEDRAVDAAEGALLVRVEVVRHDRGTLARLAPNTAARGMDIGQPLAVGCHPVLAVRFPIFWNLEKQLVFKGLHMNRADVVAVKVDHQSPGNVEHVLVGTSVGKGPVSNPLKLFDLCLETISPGLTTKGM